MIEARERRHQSFRGSIGNSLNERESLENVMTFLCLAKKHFVSYPVRAALWFLAGASLWACGSDSGNQGPTGEGGS
ncbi:MAG TPA: hypothetical protein VGL13_11230, partial [Polyangiaceae bacterium]